MSTTRKFLFQTWPIISNEWPEQCFQCKNYSSFGFEIPMKHKIEQAFLLPSALKHLHKYDLSDLKLHILIRQLIKDFVDVICKIQYK